MNRPDIVFLDADSLGEVNGFSELAAISNLTVYPGTSSGQRIERIQGKKIVITNKVVIDKEIMDACPDLKLICVAATGMNNIDLDYASHQGIAVKNVAGYSTESVVEHTFALIFSLLGNLPYYLTYVKDGSYARSNMFTHHGRPFHELSGKKLGIIGLGTIGRKVAEIALTFGADITYFSTSGKNLNTGYQCIPLEMLLSDSDIVSIHCPLNDATRNLITYKQLRLMKNQAILINTGRGGIINESDLACALNENLIAGAALDVMDQEPPGPSNPLFHLINPEKLLITPHIAWASVESRDRLMKGIISNITDFLNNNL
jgi:glycerate dehydrogenase